MKTELKTKYTVSEDTNEILNVIAEFNAVLDEMHEVVAKRYGDSSKSITEFLDAKEPLANYMMTVLNDSIREQMSHTKRTQI